ncbi:DUF899 domain-containing protein [Aestuariivirga sp. YIM B02566]|uniref:DUF899 domain-containing protein n=1 Tax=Taklimakanibacter albus TaxID=2800327 RepID=A0ACC5R6P5_9HYPH|nr:DUF899 domain-containing protein [Aestuariivirga sp. YIM B02566]MBK1868339.1 DUF899 domain-containing protein [Aestuariivirga sp. YIM B02566]
MLETPKALPKTVSRSEWLAARKALLDQEKQLTRERDALNEARRRLPMVKLDKDYVFDGPDAKASLLDLFDGRRQLIVYHFMYDPDWEKACSGCTGFVDDLPVLKGLHERDTSLAVIARAPQAKLKAYAQAKGWDIPLYSSFGGDFNYDFQATTDEKVAPSEYNYRPRAEHIANNEPWFADGEHHGISVFLREGDEIFHTYSTYARGVEPVVPVLHYLDLTPLGRQGA